MKAAVGWIAILSLALRTHTETGHCRLRPVVGNVLNNGIAWSAIGAVGEGIPEAAVRGIVDVAQAIAASCDVRRNQHELAFHRQAFPDVESRVTERLQRSRGDLFN